MAVCREEEEKRLSSAGCFIQPKPRTEYFKHSMMYSGCLVWNKSKVPKLLTRFITDV